MGRSFGDWFVFIPLRSAFIRALLSATSKGKHLMFDRAATLLVLTLGISVPALAQTPHALLPPTLSAPAQPNQVAPGSPAPALSVARPQPSPSMIVEPDAAAPKLAAVPTPGNVGPAAISADGNVGHYDFGTVSPLDTPQVEHTFVLRNNTQASLVLTRLQASCGCTTVTATALDGAAVKPSTITGADAPLPTLAPGGRAALHVVVRLQDHAPGMLYKTVLVFTQDLPQPVAVLQMEGTLRPSVSLSPPLLDFGKVATGAAHRLTLTATADARLVPTGGLPGLVSSNPAVRVAAVPPGTVPPPAGAKTVSRTYTVTLAPDAPLGSLTSTLTFGPAAAVTPAPAVAAGSPQLPGAPFAPTVVAAMAVAEVTGDIASSPELLSFGNVPEGQPQERQVQLSAAAATSFEGIKVESASPLFSGRLTAPNPAGAAASPVPPAVASQAAVPPMALRGLIITLSPLAPSGIQQTQMTTAFMWTATKRTSSAIVGGRSTHGRCTPRFTMPRICARRAGASSIYSRSSRTPWEKPIWNTSATRPSPPASLHTLIIR